MGGAWCLATHLFRFLSPESLTQMGKATKSSAISTAKSASKTSAKPVGAWRIGEKYIIRTAMYHAVGRLVSVDEHELVLEDASWVADSGRWSEALRTGSLCEVEPFVDPVIVGRGSICDATIWRHELPKTAK